MNLQAWDAKNDRVSIEAARDKYGVVVDPETFEVDKQATQTLRESLLSQSTKGRSHRST